MLVPHVFKTTRYKINSKYFLNFKRKKKCLKKPLNLRNNISEILNLKKHLKNPIKFEK
jgi:hypothetical protein